MRFCLCIVTLMPRALSHPSRYQTTLARPWGSQAHRDTSIGIPVGNLRHHIHEWMVLYSIPDPRHPVTTMCLPIWSLKHHVLETSLPCYTLSKVLTHRIYKYDKMATNATNGRVICYVAEVTRISPKSLEIGESRDKPSCDSLSSELRTASHSFYPIVNSYSSWDLQMTFPQWTFLLD